MSARQYVCSRCGDMPHPEDIKDANGIDLCSICGSVVSEEFTDSDIKPYKLPKFEDDEDVPVPVGSNVNNKNI